ncbi:MULTISPECIES: SoxR reducing system RseC family protein [Marichromatium]|uniref:RseC/MucC-like positive regulator of sigma(E) n=1 Tax=Marichromatium gracile TaxID=1048 RepID=A0A4R4A7P5_MARGR|nr:MULTISPECIES: SoxR reducing system RseC family protein [Marichromatium]MBO8086458.1 SoxR reducing system RseC family protein [Marichromatium sp.]MBK1708955.1 Fis family transcriptional regulator [Marichromatium gracile]RNE89240.1 Fis family transcriptional regulator [Marichromatium sp. AB31]RNE91769.1 Fis family transcriptional regulator [Marichromatium sp. AB32]TCW34883.1 RseC/MucC-like positive regulator of sigma(E) [Marichromatium gracile]
MIEEQGRVIARDGDHVRVRTQRRSVCGGCAARGACGTSLLERLFSRRAAEVRARDRIGVEVGDEVVLAISAQGVLRLSLAAYLAPTLGLVLGAVAGNALGGAASDPLGLLGAGLGLTLALVWLRGYSRALARDPSRQPEVIRRLGAEPLRVTLLEP